MIAYDTEIVEENYYSELGMTDTLATRMRRFVFDEIWKVSPLIKDEIASISEEDFSLPSAKQPE
jgi:hypothetical protein